jgi:hypothetical protein
MRSRAAEVRMTAVRAGRATTARVRRSASRLAHAPLVTFAALEPPRALPILFRRVTTRQRAPQRCSSVPWERTQMRPVKRNALTARPAKNAPRSACKQPGHVLQATTARRGSTSSTVRCRTRSTLATVALSPQASTAPRAMTAQLVRRHSSAPGRQPQQARSTTVHPATIARRVVGKSVRRSPQSWTTPPLARANPAITARTTTLRTGPPRPPLKTLLHVLPEPSLTRSWPPRSAPVSHASRASFARPLR